MPILDPLISFQTISVFRNIVRSSLVNNTGPNYYFGKACFDKAYDTEGSHRLYVD